MHVETQQRVMTGLGPMPRAKNVLFKGQQLRVYSIGWFSYLTYLSKETIRLWERLQVLPRPYFKLAGNLRWYSAAELVLYSKAIRDHYQSGRDRSSLRSTLQKIGIVVQREFSGFKNGKLLPKNYTALDREPALLKSFRQQKFKNKLSVDQFFEVQKLLKKEKKYASHKITKVESDSD
jgi:DNA-binding transcriptional MerR regulator